MSRLLDAWKHADSWLLVRHPRIWALRPLHVAASALVLDLMAWVLPVTLIRPTLPEPITVGAYARNWLGVVLMASILWFMATWQTRRALPLRYDTGQLWGPVTSVLVVAMLASPALVAILSAEAANRELRTSEDLMRDAETLGFLRQSKYYDGLEFTINPPEYHAILALDEKECHDFQSALKRYLSPPRISPADRDVLKGICHRPAEPEPEPEPEPTETRFARSMVTSSVHAVYPAINELLRAHGDAPGDSKIRLHFGSPLQEASFFASVGLFALLIANMISATAILDERDFIFMIAGLAPILAYFASGIYWSEQSFLMAPAIWAGGVLILLTISSVAELRRIRFKWGDRLLGIALLSPALGAALFARSFSVLSDVGFVIPVWANRWRSNILILVVLAIYLAFSPALRWLIDRYRRIPCRS